MQLEPVPTPCSYYDRALEETQKAIDKLRHEILWANGNEATALPHEPVTVTWEQWQRLLGIMQGLITDLHIAELERVRKIMGQI